MSSGLISVMGSSPRMRGTQERRARDDRPEGIIPAHAGNTSSAALQACRSRDHPRACGEHSAIQAVSEHHLRSSPRMRGTLSPSTVMSLRFGIIPAHAGNTFALLLSTGQPWDHPRACGEHTLIVGADDFNVGSSPRMRGTRPKRCARPLESGIIPAHAGNTAGRG